MASTPVDGLDAGDQLVGIDIRPADGELYAVGKGAEDGDDDVYRMDLSEPVPTAESVLSLATRLSGGSFGVDVDPVADALRVVSDAGQTCA